MLQTNVDSLKINYMDKGSGELVVLLHGWGSNIELFENMSELLALNIYSTYNISNKDHGVAQAKAVIFFLLVAALALTQQYMTRKKEVQQ